MKEFPDDYSAMTPPPSPPSLPSNPLHSLDTVINKPFFSCLVVVVGCGGGWWLVVEVPSYRVICSTLVIQRLKLAGSHGFGHNIDIRVFLVSHWCGTVSCLAVSDLTQLTF